MLLAEKDSIRPGRRDAAKCPPNGYLRRQTCPRVFGQARKPAKMFRAGLYARVSTSYQETVPLQIRPLRDYAVRRGWTIALLVKEVGSGATQRQLRERWRKQRPAAKSTRCWYGAWTDGGGRWQT